jgi:hypothetical protein
MMSQDLEERELTTTEKAAPKPALVINIQTWATPIVGLVMLLVGLAGGYFGRPFISSAEKAPPALETASASEPQVSAPAATTSPEEQASRQEMMDFIVSQTRHFTGDPEAAITIVEFSDFQ